MNITIIPLTQLFTKHLHFAYMSSGVGSTLDTSKGNRQISYKNTRFISKPFSAVQSKQSIADTATEKAKSLQGKIGLDGKEILPQQSPSVQGFGFVATPSPAPGKFGQFKYGIILVSCIFLGEAPSSWVRIRSV